MTGRAQGMTLLELIVTLAVVAITLTIGVPTFRELILNNRIVTQTNELIAALHLARSEAIKRGVRVVMCRAAGSDCATDATGVWEGDWIIFADRDGDGVRSIATDAHGNDLEPIIRVRQSVGGQLTIRTGGTFASWIAYQPSGISAGNTGLGTGTFGICDNRGVNHARFVVVNNSGRARVRYKQAGDSCP